MRNWDSFYIRQALENGTTGCGDAGMILDWKEECFCFLIDAVGHGKKAAKEANLAKAFVAEHSNKELDWIMRELHTFLEGTPGAVASLVRLNKESGGLLYCSIGNIGMKILNSEHLKSLKGQEGIIGYSIPTPRIFSARLQNNDTLIIYSDGLKDNGFGSGIWRRHMARDAKNTAINMLRAFGKDDDDRSCLVLKSVV